MNRISGWLTTFRPWLMALRQDPRNTDALSVTLRLSNGLILGCLVYLLLRPVSNNFVLIPVFFLMGLGSLAIWIVADRRFAPGFASIWLWQLYFALLGTVVGVVAGAPGLLYGVLIYAIAPILYWIWVGAFDLSTIRLAILWVFITTAALSTVIILFVAGETHVIPQLVPFTILDASGAAYAPTANTPGQIRFYGVSTLAAAGPLCAASLLVRADRLMPHVALRVYATASAVVASLVAGRRAILVVIVLAPVIAWICSVTIRGQWRMRTNRNGFQSVVGALRSRPKMAAMVVGSVVVLIGIVYVTQPLFISAIYVSFASAHAMAFGGGGGTPDVRVAEAKALLDGWAKSPWVGNGFGATLPGYSRDAARPWNFELQYHVLVFQTGLAGAVLAMAGLLAVIRQLRAAARAAAAYSGTLVVLTTGAVSLLVANAVDPYLQAPGHMWAIYLPLTVANCVLIANDGLPISRGLGSEDGPEPVGQGSG